MAPAAAGVGVKAGGCSVLAQVVIATVSVVTVVVIIAVAVPLALMNNGTTNNVAVTAKTTTSVSQTTSTVTRGKSVTTPANSPGTSTPSGSSGGTKSTETNSIESTSTSSGNSTITASPGHLETTATNGNAGNSTLSAPRTTGESGNTTSSPGGITTRGDNLNSVSDTQTTIKSTSGARGDNTSTTFTGTSTQNNFLTLTPTTGNNVTENDTATVTPVPTTTTTFQTTTPAFECSDGYNRTIILMKAIVTSGDYLFFRGGLSVALVPGGCRSTPSKCTFAIQHRTFVSSGDFMAYNAWARGDNFLDFNGLESGQGSYSGAAKPLPQGSPAVRTSKSSTLDNYLPYNEFGEDYWAMDVCMECPQTLGGWFEILGYTDTTGVESGVANINQSATCNGTAAEAGIARNFTSNYHVAMCGRLNVFEFRESYCTINNLNLTGKISGDSFTTLTTLTSPTGNNVTENDTATVTPVPTTTTTFQTTTPAFECSDGYNRTIILMKAIVTSGDYLFFRGGLTSALVPGGCRSAPSKCTFAIQHRTFVSSGDFMAYNAWAMGDNFLDFTGRESGQGSYSGVAKPSPQGSPAVRTSKNSTLDNYLPYNEFGEDFWAMDVCMECPQTLGGWFEILGYTDTTGQESGVANINQSATCNGTAAEAGIARNFASNYHVAMCGRLNVFEFGESHCTINILNLTSI